MDQGEKERCGEERGCIDRDPDPGARSGHDDASERGAADPACVLAEAQDRVCRLEKPLWDRLRDDSGRRGEEERGAEAVDRTQRRQLPDLGFSRQEQDRYHALREPADDVREDHDAVARQAVGPNSSDEQEQHLWNRPGRENEAEVGLRAGQVEDGERERDVRERVANERDRPPRKRKRNSR
jgi:hypothetical protein